MVWRSKEFTGFSSYTGEAKLRQELSSWTRKDEKSDNFPNSKPQTVFLFLIQMLVGSCYQWLARQVIRQWEWYLGTLEWQSWALLWILMHWNTCSACSRSACADVGGIGHIFFLPPPSSYKETKQEGWFTSVIMQYSPRLKFYMWLVKRLDKCACAYFTGLMCF